LIDAGVIPGAPESGVHKKLSLRTAMIRSLCMSAASRDRSLAGQDAAINATVAGWNRE